MHRIELTLPPSFQQLLAEARKQFGQPPRLREASLRFHWHEPMKRNVDIPTNLIIELKHVGVLHSDASVLILPSRFTQAQQAFRVLIDVWEGHSLQPPTYGG